MLHGIRGLLLIVSISLTYTVMLYDARQQHRRPMSPTAQRLLRLSFLLLVLHVLLGYGDR